MSSTELAKLKLVLEAETGRLQKDLDATKKKVSSFKKQSVFDIKGVKAAFLSLAGVLSIAAVKSFFSEHINGIDSLAKQASKIGIATEALQGLRYAGELTGVSANTTDMALQRMTRRIAEAANGSGEAVGALNELGLSAEELQKMPLDAQFSAIAEKMNDVERQSDRVRLSMKLFDSEGVALVNTLALGADGLAAAQEEVAKFGGAISAVDAAKVEAAKDSFTRLGASSKALGQRLAVEFSPIITAIGAKFFETSQSAAGLGNTTGKVGGVVAEAMGVAATAVHFLKIGFLGARNGVAEIVNVVVQLASVLTDAGAGIAEKLGFDAEGMRSVSAFAESFSQTTEDMRTELDGLITGPLPYESAKQWVDDVYIKAEQAAKEKVAEGGGLGHLLLGDNAIDPTVSPEVKGEADKNSLIERMRKQHKDKLLREEIAAQLKTQQFQAMTTKMKVKTLLSEAVQITQGAANTNKTLFKMNKIAALADAAVSLPRAVMSAVARGGGWPWGAAFGALTLANGVSQINAIRKAEYGGGSGTAASLAGSGGGAVPTFDTSTTVEDIVDTSSISSESGSTVQVIFNGDMLGVDDLDERVLQVVADGTNSNRIRVTDQSGRTIIEKT